ncbi:MAG: cyclic pyranopterin monophosphate synthase MoaC, partial [Thermoanaerobaculia bacterium]
MSEAPKPGRRARPRRPRDASRLRGSVVLHVDARGRARLRHDGGTRVTRRTAVARGAVAMSRAAFEALAEGRLAKGDALAVARLAGIQAAKRTSEIVPLCPPLSLESVEVDVDLDGKRAEAVVTATARITGKTGVEMEALTAVAAACLALYD